MIFENVLSLDYSAQVPGDGCLASSTIFEISDFIGSFGRSTQDRLVTGISKNPLCYNVQERPFA
jgi:hypothetical protein